MFSRNLQNLAYLYAANRTKSKCTLARNVTISRLSDRMNPAGTRNDDRRGSHAANKEPESQEYLPLRVKYHNNDPRSEIYRGFTNVPSWPAGIALRLDVFWNNTVTGLSETFYFRRDPLHRHDL